jgi:hypothetical protein
MGNRCLVFLLAYCQQKNTHRQREEEKKMSEKQSGYAIRTDILGMAIGILEHKINVSMQNEHLKPDGKRESVSPYTTEDVVSEAEKLYSFVLNKG